MVERPASTSSRRHGLRSACLCLVRALQTVCKALQGGRLQTLNLSQNKILRQGCIGVSQLVSVSRTLTLLNLDKCKIADS